MQCSTSKYTPHHPPPTRRSICSNANPLNVTEQMLLSSKQIETVGFDEGKQELERRRFLSLFLSDTWKKCAETEGSWRSFVSVGKSHEVPKEGLGACRQERECERENNQEGDLLYLFTPFLSLNRNASLIKEVNHFQELWHVRWLLFLLATKPDGNYEPYMSNVLGGGC